MLQTGGYPTHAPQFAQFEYRASPPRTPQNAGGTSSYYSPRYSATQSPGHARRSTGDPATFAKFKTTSYSTPRKTQFSQPEYSSSPGYRASAQSTPLHKSDYVSRSDGTRDGSTRYVRVVAQESGKKQQRQYLKSKHSSSRSRVVLDERSDYEYEYLPRYELYEDKPPPYGHYQNTYHYYRYSEPGTDRRSSTQIPIYTPATPPKEPSRNRRASYTAKPTQPTQPTPPRRPSTKPRSPPQATEADARHAGIPAGYSIKNWDPTEEPILLLGSVFDANSLGKWIYDWTVYFYGPATPMSEIAGELWLLLIQLAGKIKRAEECLSRIRQASSRDLVDDFLESGERLWQRFTKLLKICEGYMWRAARRESGARGEEKVTMGKNSGCEFVGSVFGRDRELEKTEKLMTGMRLWSMRFDANCEEVLRNPSA